MHFSETLCGVHYDTFFAQLNVDRSRILYPRKFVMVQLSVHEFLMESVETLSEYLVCGLPIVDVTTGRVINNFPGFLQSMHPRVDVGTLLNVHCTSTTGSPADVLQVAHLFDVLPAVTSRPRTQKLTDQEFGMLAYLFAKFFSVGELEPTAQNLPCIALAAKTLSSKEGVDSYESKFVEFSYNNTRSKYTKPCTSSNRCLKNLYGPLEVTASHPAFSNEDDYGCVFAGGTDYNAIVRMNAISNIIIISDDEDTVSSAALTSLPAVKRAKRRRS